MVLPNLQISKKILYPPLPNPGYAPDITSNNTV